MVHKQKKKLHRCNMFIVSLNNCISSAAVQLFWASEGRETAGEHEPVSADRQVFSHVA